MNQNPLTKLPGNNSIYQYISGLLEETELGHYLVYFDMNNFKAFNDKYGFRQGDRALLKFSEILGRFSGEFFIAHIGGDDFLRGSSRETTGSRPSSGPLTGYSMSSALRSCPSIPRRTGKRDI